MAGEWQTVPLSELTDPDTPVTYGVVKPGPEAPDGVLLIRGGDIAGGRVLTEQLRTITQGVSDQYRRTQLRGGEIVVSLVGNPGQVAMVPESLRGANIARQAGLVRLRKGVDTRFVKYFLTSQVGQAALGAHSLGSVQQVINLRDLKTVEVPVPPLREQRAIAHILGTLDDKIELNRRMSETLEAMARALFKSWFVDFDPVRALAEGRDLGLPKPLADLFPARLVASELGEIPEGWEVGTVSGLANVSSGKRPELRYSEPLPEASVPLWGGNGPMGFVPEPLIDEPILLTGRVGTLGSVFRISTPCWPSDNTLVVRVNRPSAFEYLYFQLRQFDYASLNRGSTQPLLTQTDLKSQRVIFPPCRILDYFSRFAGAAYSCVDSHEKESCTLAALRDTLLPKLIAGEVRVGAKHHEERERVQA